MLDYHLVSGFDKLRQKLLSPKFADRLDKPLAFWALPNDRHLPLALIGRNLNELLAAPFEELYGTPGIGPKKIATLLNLLQRASQPLPPGAIVALVDDPPETEAVAVENGRQRTAEPVDVKNVSEALWITWRDAVGDYGLGGETLGRFSPSLDRLPRVLWMTPLETYLRLSLTDIRSLKTHGEKRVRAVLEVFGGLHQIISHLGVHPSLAVRIAPRAVTGIESWISSALLRPSPPPVDEMREKLTSPLVEQLRVDGGEQIASLVESRLRSSAFNVQQAARRLGMTRARIYEMLGDVPTMIAVRWPEGKLLFSALREHLERQAITAEQRALLGDAATAFFARGADQFLPPDGHSPADGLD
ncbi:MAG TPA: hypothetical protein VHB99_02840 [Pirellulales bacterium]|nr:hypothetical protein [Pirellulales bacterium]